MVQKLAYQPQSGLSGRPNARPSTFALETMLEVSHNTCNGVDVLNCSNGLISGDDEHIQNAHLLLCVDIPEDTKEVCVSQPPWFRGFCPLKIKDIDFDVAI